MNRFHEVEEHNKKFKAGEETYELGINELSMYSYEDLLAQKTGYVPMNTTEALTLPDSRRGRAAPTSFSWTSQKGVVRAVQNQGSCGSCWAFAGVGAIEGQMAIKKNRMEKLSEQEVIECARNKYNGQLLGCGGGFGYSSYDHARDRNGITVQSNRPYRGTTSAGCNTNTPRAVGSVTAGFFQIAVNEDQIKENLYSHGPIYVTFHVSNDFFSYRSGVYTDSRQQCSGKYNNHAVLLVGYGVQNGVSYWLLKNSWGEFWLISIGSQNAKSSILFTGTGFGESGFFKLARGRHLCGIAREASFPNLA